MVLTTVRFTHASNILFEFQGLKLLGEPTFVSLSSPTITCLAIDDRTKLNCRCRDIGFELLLGFRELSEILRNVDDLKRSKIPKNEIPLDVGPICGQSQ